jgi:membrane fusion protein (multidrug efflux system)
MAALGYVAAQQYRASEFACNMWIAPISKLVTSRRSTQAGTHAAAIAIVLAASACAKQEDRKPQTAEAGYVVVKTESVELPVTLAGRTAAFEMSEVRPQVSGVIQARLFTEGSIVRAGQTLYQIDPSIYRANAAVAQANLASAEAARTTAAVRAKRLQPLAKMEAVSQQDYSDAAAAARQASASVAQNKAQLDAAQINLRFTRVPAPISGRIGRSLVTTGGLVTSNQADPLTTIQRLDPIYVDIQQSSADLLALRHALAQNNVTPSSTAVKLILEDGTSYAASGTLQFAEAMVDANTGTVTLRARFPNPSGLLLPGMYVRAALSQATLSSAILVPQAGVSRDVQGRATVYVVGANNKAIRKTITADRTIGDKWLVTAGLKPGEKVIVEGLGKIRPNATIVPVVAGSKPRPAKQTTTRG